MCTRACVLARGVRMWRAGSRGQGQILRPSVLDFSGNAKYLRGPRGRHLLVRIPFQRRFRLQDSFPEPHTSLVQAQGGPWCLTPQEVVSHAPLLSPASRPCPPPRSHCPWTIALPGAHSCPEPGRGEERSPGTAASTRCAAWSWHGQRDGMPPWQMVTPSCKPCP